MPSYAQEVNVCRIGWYSCPRKVFQKKPWKLVVSETAISKLRALELALGLLAAVAGMAAWGLQNESDSIPAIQAALDHGLNWIDTAALYGLGHSEEVVARAIKDRTSQRRYVFTKCERVWDESGNIRNRLKAAIDAPRMRRQPAPS